MDDRNEIRATGEVGIGAVSKFREEGLTEESLERWERLLEREGDRLVARAVRMVRMRAEDPEEARQEGEAFNDELLQHESGDLETLKERTLETLAATILLEMAARKGVTG